MTSRQAGQRIGIIAARRGGKRQKAARARRPAGRRSQTVRPGEQRRLLQLVACASIFVLLVAVKLLLPGRIAPVSEKLAEALARNMDVQAVFSAVGRAASGEEDPDSALEDVYQAVFQPQEELEEAAHAIRTLGAEVERVVKYAVPGTDAVHSAVLLRKSGPTPAQYPRRWAKMTKFPL